MSVAGLAYAAASVTTSVTNYRNDRPCHCGSKRFGSANDQQLRTPMVFRMLTPGEAVERSLYLSLLPERAAGLLRRSAIVLPRPKVVQFRWSGSEARRRSLLKGYLRRPTSPGTFFPR